MSTFFSTQKEALGYGLAMAGVDPRETGVVKDDNLQVLSAAGFLSDPTTPEGQERIAQDLNGQEGYRFKNKDGIELGVVVAPFRDGFSVWGVSPNGTAFRF